MPDLRRPITETSYLTADNVARYRAVMRFFYEQHQRMRYRLRPEDVVAGVKAKGYLDDYTLEQCQQDLEQLEEWKNVIAQHDGTRVQTIEEYRKKSFRYQLTKYSIEIERMVSGLERIHGFGGSLEPTHLEKIDALLEEVYRTEGMFAQGKALLHWTELFQTFRTMTENATDYIAHLESSRAEELMATEAFLVFKDSLTLYLRDFMQSLQRHSPRIEGLLREIKGTVLTRYVEQVERDEAAKPQLDLQETREERLQRLYDTWEAFSGWFLGTNGQESEVRSFERATKNAIAKVVRSALRIQDSRRSGVSRRRELEHLGRWFFQLEDVAEAHKLAAYAFGLYKTRHFQGSDGYETEAADISMWDAVPLQRALTSKSRRRLRENATAPIRNRQKEQGHERKRWLERQRAEEALLHQCLTQGEVEMAKLPPISEATRRQLLDWIGRCLASPKQRIQTLDGIRITLIPPEDGGRTVITSEDGDLELPNYTLHFTSADEKLAARKEVAASVREP